MTGNAVGTVGPYVAGTVVLCVLSGGFALGLGLLLAGVSARSGRTSRLLGVAATTVTRGVPTSLLVVTAGIVAIRFTPPAWLPNPFPATPEGTHLVAWAIVLALAVGSAGHFAVIFRAAHEALGRYRVEQVQVLGLSRSTRTRLLAREAARTALAPTGTRFVHHLHNTAFAALFPVADLFGWVQQRASATFDVVHYALVGSALYVGMGAVIWLSFRGLEARLDPSRRPTRQGRAAR